MTLRPSEREIAPPCWNIRFTLAERVCAFLTSHRWARRLTSWKKGKHWGCQVEFTNFACRLCGFRFTEWHMINNRRAHRNGRIG